MRLARTARRCGEQSTRQSGAEERSRRVSDSAGRRCRARSLRRARSGREVAGPRAMFRPRRRKRGSRAVSVSQRLEPGEHNDVTEAPPAQRATGKLPAPAGIGALRGVPARMGSARRRLACGERPFPGVTTRLPTQSRRWQQRHSPGAHLGRGPSSTPTSIKSFLISSAVGNFTR